VSEPVAPTPDAAAGAAAGSSASKPLLDQLLSLYRELPGLISDRVDLISLELHRAGRTLLQIVALLVVAAILGVTAWLVLWAGIVSALVAAGWPLVLALAVALVSNIGASAWALFRMRRLLPLLGLPATRRHLTLDPPSPAADEGLQTAHAHDNLAPAASH
jgi:hypothetical protein